ncbi:NAD(P)H-binding protein [Streptomyces sp. NPDC097619]|uniref:NmrA family NAD(P)-binding protein n=1 Tax=Streptomyces sp. NPDC097619 TaxID=3157228 RepID=UPI003317D29E
MTQSESSAAVAAGETGGTGTADAGAGAGDQTRQGTYLVAGATGTVGREVVRALLARGHRVRALTRDPARADLPAGAEVVRGDLTDPDGPDGLADALRGVVGVHLITFGGEYEPLATGARIVELVRAAGVRRVTVLHGGGPTPLEEAVRAAPDLEWTVLMPVEFMANALQWAESVRATGEVRAGFVDGLSAMVHESDIGEAAAVALTEDGHAGREYLLTGPQSLTVHAKVAALAAGLGREVRLVALDDEQAADVWRAEGRDEETVAWLVDVFRNTPPEGSTVNDTVPRLTGRPARTFEDWARDHAAAFG